MSKEIDPKQHSRVLTEGPSRAAARSYFRSVGFTKEDLQKPIIGIANTWTEVGPCNFHLRQVAEAVKQGVREAGGTPMEFNTITVHDGITMGTQGMKASLVSREVIADSIELVTRANSFDGLICIAGCDKNMPAAIMALGRLDIPGLMLYGGSIAPGKLPQPDGTVKEITILQVFEGMGAHAAGKINDAQLEALEAAACPGPGACGGQFTANTMAMAGEFLGISPINITGVPAMDPHKAEASREAGRLVMQLARTGLTPRKIVTRKAIENAYVSACASGGSTNAVLHLLAIAHEYDIPFTIDDFNAISDRTPLICDLSPGGKYAAKDYQDAGGSRLLAQRLLDAGLIDGSQMTVSGKTLAEESTARRRNPQPARHLPHRPPAQGHRRPRHPQGQPRPRGLRRQGRRPRARPPHRPRTRLQLRGRLPRRRRSRQDQTQRRLRHPLRRPPRRPRHARDARRHRRHQRHSRTL